MCGYDLHTKQIHNVCIFSIANIYQHFLAVSYIITHFDDIKISNLVYFLKSKIIFKFYNYNICNYKSLYIPTRVDRNPKTKA